MTRAEQHARHALWIAEVQGGALVSDVAARAGVTREAVYSAFKLAGCSVPPEAGRAKHAERMRRMNADPVFAAKHAERMRKMHADPVFAAKHAERGAERMRKMHADPVFAAKHAAKHAERMRKMHADRRGFEIPPWVDRAGLRDHFVDIARAKGEEAAATACRALKQLAMAAP